MSTGNCEQLGPLVELHRDGLLSQSEGDRLRDHIAGCDVCGSPLWAGLPSVLESSGGADPTSFARWRSVKPKVPVLTKLLAGALICFGLALSLFTYKLASVNMAQTEALQEAQALIEAHLTGRQVHDTPHSRLTIIPCGNGDVYVVRSQVTWKAPFSEPKQVTLSTVTAKTVSTRAPEPADPGDEG